MRKKRFALGGPTGGTIAVGAYTPQAPTSSSPTVDRSQTTREVLDTMQQANTPTLTAKKGGYVESADGCACRGKTRGKYV
jgi:hypothetical protein